MTKLTISKEGGFRTQQEDDALKKLSELFVRSPDPIETKLENFTKYIRGQKLTRLLALYEIFKKILPTKGSVVEGGVHQGFGLMTWAHLSSVLEPTNLTRRIYGFDTFDGFPDVSEEDKTPLSSIKKGDLTAHSFEELTELIKIYNTNRFLGHIEKVRLINGDVTKTIPEFIQHNKHLMVSLLFLDFDLYEPTKIALEHFYPRMPKGAILAFDELDNPLWPGETTALLKTIGINSLKIKRLAFDPYIGYAVI